MDNIEIWKQIKDFKNYEISSFGRVKNTKYNKIIYPHLKDGYERIGLTNEKRKQKKFAISRLVAEAFLKSFDKNLDVDHIDRNPKNNNINNLRCVSKKENSNNRNNNKLFKIINFIEIISKENSFTNIEELINYFKLNNQILNQRFNEKKIINLSGAF